MDRLSEPTAEVPTDAGKRRRAYLKTMALTAIPSFTIAAVLILWAKRRPNAPDTQPLQPEEVSNE